MRRFLIPTTHLSLLLSLWLATLVSSNTVSVTNKPATWHKALIGVPETRSTGSSPTLHHLPLKDGKVLGYLLTSTTKNTLAALDPVGGSVVWRHVLEEDDQLEEFQANHDGIVALSGLVTQVVRLHEVRNGAIIWEAQLPKPDLELLPYFKCIGSCIVFATDGTPDFYVSSNAGTIHRLNGLTGATQWTWNPIDGAPLTSLSKMVATPTAVYLIHFVDTTNAFQIHITAIDSTTGEQIFTKSIVSKVHYPASDTVIVGDAKQDQSTLVWAQEDGAKYLRLSELKTRRHPKPLYDFKKVTDVRLGNVGMFVAFKSDGSSAIMKLDPEHGDWLTTLWTFSDSADTPNRSPSIFIGGFDKFGRPYLSRTFWSNHLKACSMELYIPHQHVTNGFYYSYNTVQHGVILHATMDVANAQTGAIPRFIITTSSGSVQMWQKEQFMWVREEALAHIASAAYVKMPHPAGKSAVVTSSLARLTSQAGELARAPINALVGLTKVFLSVYPSSSSSNSTTLDERFGFRHLIVAATTFGKVIALDSTTGEVVWGQLLSISDVSGQPLNTDMRLFATEAETEGVTSDLFLIAKSPTDDSSLVYHLHPFSGSSLGNTKSRGFVSPSFQFTGSVADATVIGSRPARLVMIDTDHKIHAYPPAAFGKGADLAPYMNFVLPSDEPAQMAGYKLYQGATGSQLSASQTWAISLGKEETILLLVAPPARYPAVVPNASGNNTIDAASPSRNLVGIVTSAATSTEAVNCIVRVVDGTKGTLVYRADLGRGDCDDVKAVFVGDLFVYSYQETVAATDSAKGFRITTVDLPPVTGTSANPNAPLQQRTFAVGFKPKYLATTQTKYGIALQDLIVATQKDQIMALPNRLLRTLGAPLPAGKSGPPNNLFQDEPRLTISQIWQVADVEDILATSSQLESTSLVFAYGRDLFATTVAPSGTFDLLSEDFSRSQLLTTLAVLLVAVLMTRPLARNRELMRQWFTS